MIPDLLRHTRILGIVGDILKVRALGVAFGDVGVVENWDGRTSLGVMAIQSSDETPLP